MFIIAATRTVRKVYGDTVSQLFFNPLIPVPTVTSLGLSSISDVINFDQLHLYSTAAGGKVLFSNTQIRVFHLMVPRDMHKNAQKVE